MSRRRALAIIAGSSAAMANGLLANPVLAGNNTFVRRDWQGTAFGAPVSIRLHHHSQHQVDVALKAALAEVTRLEALFSLYQSNSAICQLNRVGALAAPGKDFIAILDACEAIHLASGGVFDPTVQPLWSLLNDHFASAPDSNSPPETFETIRSLSGFNKLVRDANGLRFAQAGMAITLNGIAQGYATDRVRDVLAQHGLSSALINLGEYRALGQRGDGRPWRIALNHPGIPWRTIADFELAAGMAVATSAPAGTPFSTNLDWHHLLDPHSGISAKGWASVTVMARDATIADGLSTALAVAAPTRAREIVEQFSGARALLLDAGGAIHRLPPDALP